MILHFLLWDGQGFCPYEQEEMWWLILWPLISHRSYLGSRHWQWVFVALQHCPIVTDATTHMFLESCSLYILTRKQNYSFCLYYSVSSVLVRVSSRPALLHHLHSCPSLALWSRPFVNQEVLSVTTLCRTKTLYGQHECMQLIFQASRHVGLPSTNTLFPVGQPEDSKDCCWPRCIS